jgi:hypothetical protein
MWLVGLRQFVITPSRAAGASNRTTKAFNKPSAIAAVKIAEPLSGFQREVHRLLILLRF